MVFLVAWVRRELSALGIPPLKRLGQHFLVDRKVRAEMIEVAALSGKDTVLEVGPGLGFLTAHLAERSGRVIAIEKDRTLAKYLKDRLSGYRNVTVIEGDALTVDMPNYTKIVSTPPYNISSKLILLVLQSHYELASLLLQQEFARRLTALSGSSDYGRLTVMLQCRAEAKLVTHVPRSAFYPNPRVDSALVTITPMREKPAITDMGLFEDLVRSFFTQRRRRLRGVLTRYMRDRYADKFQPILQRVYVPEKRVFETSVQELVNLSNEIADTATRFQSEGSSNGN